MVAGSDVHTPTPRKSTAAYRLRGPRKSASLHGCGLPARASTILPARHCAVPALQLLKRWQFRLPAVEVVPHDPVEIVIHKQRTFRNEIFRRRQHIVDGLEQLGELTVKLRAVARPLLETTLAKLSLLETGQQRPLDKGQRGNDVTIIHLETNAFQVVLDVARQDRLDAFLVAREQLKLV